MSQKEILNALLPALANADEKSLYRILFFVGRKKRREVLRKFSEVLKGKDNILKGQSEEVKAGVERKLNNILQHYKQSFDEKDK